MYNFIFKERSILFNTHLGAYEGIMRCIEPKPDIVILGAGGRANHNGRPFQGSAAQFLTNQLQWLGNPPEVFFSLHDKSIIKPYYTDTTAAKLMMERDGRTRVVDTELGKQYELFQSDAVRK
ncbi:uncharacterized protein AB675_45 [Cyphellophora attinorum]|uniref:Uncharacterized protein n=1 Tax=Cyphellophora attinorum TaxID=1664694 RepID=A0A0N1GX23_9EURO|nr:uncharacterized protein AB675_45 [Phialophora attinorum]KPI34677.1 hypothetical protein AB675_45 [Phialophora attinorum]